MANDYPSDREKRSDIGKKHRYSNDNRRLLARSRMLRKMIESGQVLGITAAALGAPGAEEIAKEPGFTDKEIDEGEHVVAPESLENIRDVIRDDDEMSRTWGYRPRYIRRREHRERLIEKFIGPSFRCPLCNKIKPNVNQWVAIRPLRKKVTGMMCKGCNRKMRNKEKRDRAGH